MAFTEIPIPLKGRNDGMPVGQGDMATTGYINNCRPRDILEGRLRLGQRPGLKKAFSQQIGGSAVPIVWIGSITTVD